MRGLPILITTMALCASASAQQPRDRAAASARTASLSGVVVDEREQPVSRALVTVVGGFEGGSRTSVSREDGRFLFTNLPIGAVRIMASRAGHPPVEYGRTREDTSARVQLEASQNSNVRIVLPRGGVITGFVLDPNGEPAPSRSIQVWTRGEGGSLAVPAGGHATSDHQGRYRVWGLSPGEYVVSADTDENRSFHPETRDESRAAAIKVAAGEEREGIDIRLLPPLPRSRVDGVAFDTAGQVVKRVQVTLLDAMTGKQVSMLHPLFQADGRFTWIAVPAGEYRVVASLVNYSPAAPGTRERASTAFWGATPLSIGGGAPAEVSVRLQPTMTVSGRIVADGAAPPPDLSGVNITVVAVDTPGAESTTAMSRTLPDGRFTIQHLPAGRYRLRASATFDPTTGWTFGRAMLGGLNLFEHPFEVKQGAALEGIVVTITRSR